MFLKSSETFSEFSAATNGSPEPYEEFLCGIRLIKGVGKARLSLTPDRWIVLEGAVAALEECVRKFLAVKDDDHTHLYTTPISLIIEADSTYGSDLAA